VLLEAGFYTSKAYKLGALLFLKARNGMLLSKTVVNPSGASPAPPPNTIKGGKNQFD